MVFKPSASTLLTSIVLALAYPEAIAAEFTKSVLVNSSLAYDTNPAMIDQNREVPVWIFTLTPELLLEMNDEINRWFVDAAVAVQRHSNESVLVNREDPRLAAGWDRTYESGLYGAKVSYEESSSRQAELLGTGSFTNSNSVLKTTILAGKWQRHFDPRWSSLIDGAYRDATFSNTAGLGSYSLVETNAKLSYVTSEQLDTFVQLGYAKYSPDKIFQDTNLYRLSVGGTYQVSSALDLAARGGAYKISGQQNSTGWEAGAGAKYTAERMIYNVDLSRSLDGGGIRGFQKSDALKASWLFLVSETDNTGVDYAFTRAKKDIDINVDRITTQQLGGFYQRKLNAHWQGKVTAAFKSLETSITKSHGGLFGITLTYDTLSF